MTSELNSVYEEETMTQEYLYCKIYPLELNDRISPSRAGSGWGFLRPIANVVDTIVHLPEMFVPADCPDNGIACTR